MKLHINYSSNLYPGLIKTKLTLKMKRKTESNHTQKMKSK